MDFFVEVREEIGSHDSGLLIRKYKPFWTITFREQQLRTVLKICSVRMSLTEMISVTLLASLLNESHYNILEIVEDETFRVVFSSKSQMVSMLT